MLKHPYFKGMQEANTVNTIPSANAITVQAVENYDDINDLLKTSEQPVIKNNTINNNSNKSSNQVHLQSLLPDNAKIAIKKPVAYKDSIDDIDDMLLDFEKKYSNNSNKNESTNNSSNVNLKNPQAKIVNSSTSIYPVVKTPQQRGIINNNNSSNANNNNNNNIRDSILAQFKEDPIFAELLQTNTHLNSKTNTIVQNTNTNSSGYLIFFFESNLFISKYAKLNSNSKNLTIL